jgi:hypothetical protein
MPDPVDKLILDLLEWIGPNGQPFHEAIEARRTSSPRLRFGKRRTTAVSLRAIGVGRKQ